ncbi:hypothetical protein GY21_07735 [Cryobacterium roopkundense]|uniref:Sulfur carrier protein n=1 Tax=Cryobacterium roopkundense TaxID=1001240 RepID=A0A099JGB8_9MICO|nr:sulfur carrier protein ThiS [Cryobacterium roopkundense]KGJ77509.1 hypothetical protein GY21_07735 [Cryobacterium roopkundense]MBB5642569.1 sulfur carrier protein [Cryobacterium roopkundense]
MPESPPTVTLNGTSRAIAAGDTVTHLVAEITGDPANTRGIAVALNSRVVPRSRWADTALNPGDEIELVSAAQGG